MAESVKVCIGRDLLTAIARKHGHDLGRKIETTIERLRSGTDSPGLDFKRPQNVAHHSLRTCRVDDYWRMVLCEPGRASTGERVIVALNVFQHDEAYRWCERNVPRENPVLNAFEIIDVTSTQAVAASLAQVAGPSESSLLFPPAIRDRELVRLGVPEQLIPALRLFTSEAQLEGVSALLPPQIQSTLLGLAAGMSPDEVHSVVLAEYGAPESVMRSVQLADEARAGDQQSIFGSSRLADVVLSPASSLNFRVLDDGALADAIRQPWALWRVFLHPQQQHLIERSYRGSARVTGGPGTGKSVVAIHRAAHLAKEGGPGTKVLLTTYTRNLARQLHRDLATLLTPDDLKRVDVVNIDALVSSQYEAVVKKRLSRLDSSTSDQLWREVAARHDLAPTFLAAEWNEVIEAFRISTAEEYQQVDRRGRGTALGGDSRSKVWQAFVTFRTELDNRGKTTYATAADEVADKAMPCYDHIVVDEAQDLTPSHWRLLRAITPSGPDDLFIVGDGKQRIYSARRSLSSLGIETRGRSAVLKICYRSTKQIVRWAEQIMTSVHDQGLDDETTDAVGARAVLMGMTPEVIGTPDRESEMSALVAAVQNWLATGIAPSEVVVAGRTKQEVFRARKALSDAGVSVQFLDGDTDPADGHVHVATMHRLKGLEYRCVAVAGASDGVIPNPVPLRQAEDDLARSKAMVRERALLYVACTRAREELRVFWAGAPSPLLP